MIHALRLSPIRFQLSNASTPAVNGPVRMASVQMSPTGYIRAEAMMGRHVPQRLDASPSKSSLVTRSQRRHMNEEPSLRAASSVAAAACATLAFSRNPIELSPRRCDLPELPFTGDRPAALHRRAADA